MLTTIFLLTLCSAASHHCHSPRVMANHPFVTQDECVQYALRLNALNGYSMAGPKFWICEQRR